MALELDPNLIHVALARHFQQKLPEGADPTKWHPSAPLDFDIARPVAARVRKVHIEGVEDAIVFAGHSGLFRAAQSLERLVPLIGSSTVELIPELGPINEDDWAFLGGVMQTKPPAGTIARAAFAAGHSDFLHGEGVRMYRVICDVAIDKVGPGQLALLVSHDPLCSCAEMVAMHLAEPPLDWGKGEIGVFSFRPDGNLATFKRYPIPPAPVA